MNSEPQTFRIVRSPGEEEAFRAMDNSPGGVLVAALVLVAVLCGLLVAAKRGR